jgi:uncharacterized protein (DUF305 family)
MLMLLLAVTLVLASCGSSASGGDMQGMDHGDEEGAKKAQDRGSMQGMDHGEMGHGSSAMASEMLMEDGEYSDERFIDAMVPHHQGAIDMAEVALENAEHEKVRALAEDIVSAQEAEIKELSSIKEEEYGSLQVPMEMRAQEMEAMGMTMGPGELANQEPFDKAFIDNMIPHHKSAIEMANVALENSENPRVREIARAIVDAQQREITRMEGWRKEWYPEG